MPARNHRVIRQPTREGGRFRSIDLHDDSVDQYGNASPLRPGDHHSPVFSGDGAVRDCVDHGQFDPVANRIASAGRDRTVRLWNVATGQETATLKGHTNEVHSVAFSPDGARIASASWDHTVKFWDAATGETTATLKGHAHHVTCVAFSPDGTRLASAGDQTVKLWDAVTGLETATLSGHTNLVQGVTFSPDGARLASASSDQTVRLWDVATGQEAATLKGHTNWVVSVAFCPDGTRLASASWDKTVKLWDARPWTPELRLEQQACCLLNAIAPKAATRESLLKAIESNRTFTEPARKLALHLASTLPLKTSPPK